MAEKQDALRSSHHASSERADLAAAEFLELANTTSLLATAQSWTPKKTELLRQRILDVDEEVRAAAVRLGRELRDAERSAQEATDRLEAEQRDADEEIRSKTSKRSRNLTTEANL